MSPFAIETRGLGRQLGKRFALHDVTLKVPSGSVYGFLGANGSGKTSTIRCLLGLLRATSGSITVLGHDIPGALPAALRRIGYVPERPHLIARLTVRAAMQLHAAFWEHSWDQGQADRLQRDFHLDPDTEIRRLSKGETGKLMMLLALAQRPDLLILDEPTDGLDPVVRRDVLSSVLDYVGETGATVFISSHLVSELERICDWVGVLDAGTIVAELPMQTFKDGLKRLRIGAVPASLPETPFALLGRMPAALVSDRSEEWVVRGWEAPMREWFAGAGVELREVIDLDLEEGFVELLRAARRKENGR
jgi:ABC-2 type transport system ATP-binding protein